MAQGEDAPNGREQSMDNEGKVIGLVHAYWLELFWFRSVSNGHRKQTLANYIWRNEGGRNYDKTW